MLFVKVPLFIAYLIRKVMIGATVKHSASCAKELSYGN